MKNILGQSTYDISNPIISIGRWELLFYLIIAFLIGYMVHYFFSHRRDYVRSPRRKKAFYYNNDLSGGYYPNSEPIVPRKIIQTQVVTPTPVQYTAPQAPIAATAPQPVAKKIIIKSTKDDLKKIEGIGPKIEELLNNAGIHTWFNLSKASVSNLKLILDDAGKRFQMHDPSTWAEQAHLAETGQWNALQEYQDFLNGGKHV